MNTADYKYDVFISYTKEEADFVRRFAEALYKQGLRVFYDQGELQTGDARLRRQIEEALERSNYFILVITPNYMVKTWTQFYLGVALSRESQERRQRIILLYLRMDPSELKKFSSKLAERPGIFAKDYSLDELAEKVRQVVCKTKEVF